MSKVTIYTRPMCGYCARAVRLLTEKGVAFDEIDAGFDQDLRRQMVQRSNGANTFPQIFINGDHIGGCDEMMALDRAGKLDALLAA